MSSRESGWPSAWQAGVLVVARKELTEIVRDKRSLFVLLLLPVLLYPLLFIGGLLAATAQVRKLATQEHRVWVEDLDQLPEGLRRRLDEVDPGQGKSFALKLSSPPARDEALYDEALTERRVAAVLRGAAQLDPAGRADADPPRTVEVLYNGGIDASTFVMRGLARAVEAWRVELVQERLARAQLPQQVLEPVATVTQDRGAKGAVLARLLSAFLVMLALTGAFYPALDLGAGEKERGTLETLLLAPVPRVTLALGKFAAVFGVALVCALLHLLSLGLTFTSFSHFGLEGKRAAALALEIDPWLFPAMLLVLVPLVALFSAVSLALATFAASYKEGQAYLTPVILLGTAPAFLGALPGMELSPVLCLVPVLSAVLLMKGLLAHTVWGGQVVLVVLANLAYAAVGVRWVASLYQREEVLWRPAAAKGPDLFGLSGGPTPGQRLPTLPQAVALATLALLLLWFVGVPLQRRHIVIGLAVTLLGLVALPTVAYARLLRLDWVATFSWRLPSLRTLGAVVLLALGCVVCAVDLTVLQQQWLGPISPEELEAMEKQAGGLLELPFPAVLVLLALLPAVCEELCFRGFVLAGLRRAGGSVGPVLVSALMFAILHLDPARLLPTFLVGAVLGAVVVRCGSLPAAMLLHFLYNSLALASEHLQDPLVAGGLLADDRPTWLARGVALGCLIAGVALLRRARTQPAPMDPGPEAPR